MKKLRGTWLAATLLLFAASCNSAKDAAFVAPARWEGREVQNELGPVKLLDEPGGVQIATLPTKARARVMARQVDEAGQVWLQVQMDSLAGWAPQDLLSLAEGEGGHIATH